MKPPCEVVCLEILPAARAYIANRLAEKGLPQMKIAELMGLTQPAVSQYRRKMRGLSTDMFEKNAELRRRMDGLAERIANGLPVKDQSVTFKEICKYILRKGLACDLHKRNDRSLDDCDICLASDFCSR
jgi:hypothetical protein